MKNFLKKLKYLNLYKKYNRNKVYIQIWKYLEHIDQFNYYYIINKFSCIKINTFKNNF